MFGVRISGEGREKEAAVTPVGTLGRTLVLNADGLPHNVMDAEEALWDVMAGNAFLVEPTGRQAHSQHLTVEIPSVVQLYRYVSQPPGTKPRSVPLTPRNVAARDGYRCAYGPRMVERKGKMVDLCEGPGSATTIDHVIPRGQGGQHSWLNVVAACRSCNHAKANRTPEQWGHPLQFQPWRPQGAIARVLAHAGRGHPEWRKYLR